MGNISPILVPLPALGRAIRYLREKRGTKQGELAMRAGMGKSQLSLYEGDKRTPNVEGLFRILAVLDCDLHDLHNALQIVTGRTERVCSGRAEGPLEAAAEKFAEGISLLIGAYRAGE